MGTTTSSRVEMLYLVRHSLSCGSSVDRQCHMQDRCIWNVILRLWGRPVGITVRPTLSPEIEQAPGIPGRDTPLALRKRGWCAQHPVVENGKSGST